MNSSSEAVATFGKYIERYEPVDDRGLDELLRLAEIDAERRDAYNEGFRDGTAAVRDASLAISAAYDWRQAADEVAAAQAAQLFRQRMLDAGPRACDFAGLPT